MADLLSRSNQVQSTEWSLNPQLFIQICYKWITPNAHLFATRLNHQVPLYISPVSDQKGMGHRCSKDKLLWSHCLYLPSHSSPSQGDPKIRLSSCLIIVISPGWPGVPWFWDLVQLSTEISHQLPMSRTFLNSPIIMCFTAIHI